MCANINKGNVPKNLKSAKVSWRRQHLSVHDKLAFVLESTEFHDVTFQVGKSEEKISTSKYMLIVSSDVFDTMFRGPLKPTNNDAPIEIPDVDPAAFRTLLKFIYTDKLDTLLENAMEVWYVAEKYDIPKLVTQVLAFMETSISNNTAVSIYQFALLMDQHELSVKAYSYITTNFAEIALQEDFLNLTLTTLAKIVLDDETKSQEIIIFQSAIRWAYEECRRQELDVSPANYRVVLKEVINNIRYPLIGVEDFASKVCPTNILSDEEEVKVFQNILLSPFKREGRPEFKCCWNNFPRKKMIFSAKLWLNRERSLHDNNMDLKNSSGYNKMFKVDRPMFLTSLILNPICERNTIDTVLVSVKMGDKKEIIYSKEHSLIPYSVQPQLFCLEFNQPIPIKSNTDCTIEIHLTGEAVPNIMWHHKDLPVACSSLGEIIFREIQGPLPIYIIDFSLQQQNYECYL